MVNGLRTFIVVFFLVHAPVAGGLDESGIRDGFIKTAEKTVGERIAYWAASFVGTPYDPDPLGIYVRRSVIVADDMVDCMYLTFRAVELALAKTPEDAVNMALDKRFHGRGVLSEGKVMNYDDRFETGEEMIASGKWGAVITESLGKAYSVTSVRTGKTLMILSPKKILESMEHLKSGDILFFVKYPHRQKYGELVGHMGFAVREALPGGKTEISMVHAGGVKGKGGRVRSVPLEKYIASMPFRGLAVTRFSPD